MSARSARAATPPGRRASEADPRAQVLPDGLGGRATRQRTWDWPAPRCTDARGLLVFVVFSAGLAKLVLSGLRHGDRRVLIHGLDHEGRLCGLEDIDEDIDDEIDPNVSAHKRGQFVHWCIDGDEVRWDWPVCVSECPSGSSPSPTDCKEHWGTSAKSQETRQVAGFCVPAALGTQELLHVAEAHFAAPPGSATRLEELANVWATPGLARGMAAAAAASGFLWLICLAVAIRFCAWMVLLASSLATAGLGGNILAMELGAPLHLHGASASALANIGRSGRFGLGFLLLGIGLWGLTAFWSACKRHSIAVAVHWIQEACSIIIRQPFLWLLPFLCYFAKLVLIAAAVAAALICLSTAEVHPLDMDVIGVPVAGFARTFKWSGKLISELAYLSFALLWYSELVSVLSAFALAHTASSKYFAPTSSKRSSVLALVQHSGSLVLGSFTRACLWLPSLLGLATDFISDSTYADMVCTGTPFFAASLRASNMIAREPAATSGLSTTLQLVMLLGGAAYSMLFGFFVRTLLASDRFSKLIDLSAVDEPDTIVVLTAMMSYLVVYTLTASVIRVSDVVRYCHALEHDSDNFGSGGRAVSGADRDEFVDPITHEVMLDPVVAADGNTYERDAITRWLNMSNRSPMTNLPLSHRELVPNRALRRQIVASQSTSSNTLLALN